MHLPHDAVRISLTTRDRNRTLDLGLGMDGIIPSLEAFLTNLIDYAGLFPPAALPLPAVLENYRRYLESPDRWMLNRLVLPAPKLSEVAMGTNWRVTLLVDDEPGPLPPQVETLETKVPRKLSLPTYCEAPIDQISGAFAKVRTATPDSLQLASFLEQAAVRRLPFKATAGLHHPVRSAAMHGFLNVFTAAAFAWHGIDRDTILEVIDDTDPAAFQFSRDGLRWRARSLSTAEIQTTRRDFAHSFGSCSFEEPLADLRALGLLP